MASSSTPGCRHTSGASASACVALYRKTAFAPPAPALDDWAACATRSRY